MQPFKTVTGPAAPLMLNNIDTDVIVRIERLTSLAPHELGAVAFEALRYFPDGSENPNFILNRPRFRDSPILIAGANFGCGSSREGAVVALMSRGIRCVIAPSFGNIFFNNCFQNGMLPIVLEETCVEVLGLQAADGEPITVDLVTQTISTPGSPLVRFEIDRMRRESLLEGLDVIALTLRDEDTITAWQARDRLERPWVWLAPASAFGK